MNNYLEVDVKDVKRHSAPYAQVNPDEDGLYVLLDDYAAALSKLAAAEQRVSELLVMLRQAWVDTEVSAQDCRKIDDALNPNPR